MTIQEYIEDVVKRLLICKDEREIISFLNKVKSIIEESNIKNKENFWISLYELYDKKSKNNKIYDNNKASIAVEAQSYDSLKKIIALTKKNIYKRIK